MDQELRQSIIRSAHEMLAARGASVETVDVADGDLVVVTPEARRTAPLGGLVASWNVLPPNERARRLASVLEGVAPAPPVGASRATGRTAVAWAVAATLSLGAIASVAWARGEAAAADARRKAREVPATPAPESSAMAARRNQAVCSGVRKRVAGGAPFGPFEAEGWVVELWLGREDGSLTPSHAALAPLGGKRVPAELDPQLAEVDGVVQIAELPVPPGAADTARAGGSLVQLQGAYAAAYLDPLQRERFVALADRLYDRTGAQLGALWARCGELPWHDLGAWYRGRDRGAAAGAMMFMAGRYSDSGAVPATSRDGSANTLAAFVTRARGGADDRTLALAIDDVGGKVATSDATGVTIHFPLGGYTLATRSSRELVALLDR